MEAVIDGEIGALASAIAADPALVHARSTRVTHFDPPVHRATLLHYVAANGVEGYRQRTPGNAVDVARTLLDAGAAPDAVADMYGGQCTTMSMLASSDHPARAGVQVALIDTLVDFGASVEAIGEGAWTSPLLTALTFGFVDAAEALVRRGARVDTLAAAAGLGRAADVHRLLPIAVSQDRHLFRPARPSGHRRRRRAAGEDGRMAELGGGARARWRSWLTAVGSRRWTSAARPSPAGAASLVSTRAPRGPMPPLRRRSRRSAPSDGRGPRAFADGSHARPEIHECVR